MNGNSRGSERCACERAIILRPDWLLYVTGGLAYGRSEYSFNFTQPGAANNFPPSPTTYVLRQSSTDIGYAVGFGGERMRCRREEERGDGDGNHAMHAPSA